MFTFASSVPWNTHAPIRSRQKRATVICSTRRRLPRSLPPVLPKSIIEQQRAIQLLGNYTQRRPSTKLIEQITIILGTSPTSKEEAGCWKRGLQYATRRRQRPPQPSQITRTLTAQVHLPKGKGMLSERQISRAFSVLEKARRRLNSNKVVSVEMWTELKRLTGVVPTSQREIRVTARALAKLAYRRRCNELEPVRFPTSREELQRSSMLLGSFARRGSIGAQTEVLRRQLGCLPRTKNVARSWKKLVDRQRVRLARRERAAIRRAAADEVRRQRKAWRELPQWARNVAVFGRRIRKWIMTAAGGRK